MLVAEVATEAMFLNALAGGVSWVVVQDDAEAGVASVTMPASTMTGQARAMSAVVERRHRLTIVVCNGFFLSSSSLEATGYPGG
jgi:hypothetical protein